MLPLFDILIILTGISAAQAGLIRRYVNTTSLPAQSMTGVAYRPYAGGPSLSLAPIQGITTLPLSQLAETSAEAPTAPSASTLALSGTSPAVVTRAASFEYQPLGSDTSDNDGSSSKPCKSQTSGAPTSFWTFGDQHVGTVTITSTTYTTISVPPHAVQSSPPQESTPGQAQNTTTISVPQISQTFSFDPLPKPTSSSTADSEVTTATAETIATSTPISSNPQPSEATSTFAYPYPTSNPSPASSTAADAQSDTSETAVESSSTSTTYSELPVVVTEGTPPETQAQQTTDMTAAIPGITILPLNPSVIYVTVTDAGATTTVTA